MKGRAYKYLFFIYKILAVLLVYSEVRVRTKFGEYILLTRTSQFGKTVLIDR